MASQASHHSVPDSHCYQSLYLWPPPTWVLVAVTGHHFSPSSLNVTLHVTRCHRVFSGAWDRLYTTPCLAITHVTVTWTGTDGGPAVHPPPLSRQQVSSSQRLSQLGAGGKQEDKPLALGASGLGWETVPTASVLSRALAHGSNPARTVPLPPCSGQLPPALTAPCFQKLLWPSLRGRGISHSAMSSPGPEPSLQEPRTKV